jgi:hypothetical protein
MISHPNDKNIVTFSGEGKKSDEKEERKQTEKKENH